MLWQQFLRKNDQWQESQRHRDGSAATADDVGLIREVTGTKNEAIIHENKQTWEKEEEEQEATW